MNKEASAYFPLQQEITLPNFQVLFALKVYDSTLSKHTRTYAHLWLQFSSVAQSCLTLCDPMYCSTQGFFVHHQLSELAQTHINQVVDTIQPSHPLSSLLLLLSIFPSIRIFSNESVLCIRWPKYWSFRISISPSNEYSGLISFRMDWLDLLEVQGTLKSLVQCQISRHQLFGTQLSS